MKKYLLYVGILLMVALLFWVLLSWQPAKQQQMLEQGELAAAPTGGDFSLLSHQGEVRLQDFRGKVVLLYFGYTWCPDICPTNLSLISMALNALTESELRGVQPIFVSVDPQRDTPERMREYCEYFHPELIGLSGKQETILEITKRYGAAYKMVKQDSQINYAVDHTADTYLIDQSGKLLKTLPHGTASELILKELKLLLSG